MEPLLQVAPPRPVAREGEGLSVCLGCLVAATEPGEQIGACREQGAVVGHRPDGIELSQPGSGTVELGHCHGAVARSRRS